MPKQSLLTETTTFKSCFVHISCCCGPLCPAQATTHLQAHLWRLEPCRNPQVASNSWQITHRLSSAMALPPAVEQCLNFNYDRGSCPDDLQAM